MQWQDSGTPYWRAAADTVSYQVTIAMTNALKKAAFQGGNSCLAAEKAHIYMYEKVQAMRAVDNMGSIWKAAKK